MKFHQLAKTLCLSVALLFGLSPPVYSGAVCGSNKGGDLSKLYKSASTDYWPDAVNSLAASIVVSPKLLTVSAICSTQGKAYFGDGCQIHDDCYDGTVGIYMTKTECDNLLLNRWQQACNNTYKPSSKKICRNSCNDTAKAMKTVVALSKDQWKAAQSEREKNYLAAINNVYLSVYNRTATDDEIDFAQKSLKKNRSLEDLTTKVKKDYARSVQASISVITQLVLEE